MKKVAIGLEVLGGLAIIGSFFVADNKKAVNMRIAGVISIAGAVAVNMATNKTA